MARVKAGMAGNLRGGKVNFIRLFPRGQAWGGGWGWGNQTNYKKEVRLWYMV